MIRGFVGQAIGVASIATWIPLTVYFMSRAADPKATDTGNWFVGFVLITVAFVLITAFWGRFFGRE